MEDVATNFAPLRAGTSAGLGAEERALISRRAARRKDADARARTRGPAQALRQPFFSKRKAHGSRRAPLASATAYSVFERSAAEPWRPSLPTA